MIRNVKFANSQKGYSMVEILVTMLIVPFGLMGVAKFQSNVMITGAESKTRSEALYAAERKIEQIRSFTNNATYNAISSGSDSIPASPGSNAALTRSWTVTDSMNPNYKTVIVNVGWTGPDNENKSISLTSFVSMAEPVASGKQVLNDTTTLVPPPPDPTSYSITLSGFISYGGNGSNNWSVSINGVVCDSGTNSSSYNCVFPDVPWGDTPTLSVTLESSGTICGINAINPSFSNSSSTGMQNFSHAQNAAKCS